MATRGRAVIAAGLILAGILMAENAFAQTQCGERTRITAALAEDYREAQRAVGVTPAGTVIELWTTDNGSTFTLFVTVPTGVACVIASGERWQRIRPMPRGIPM